MNKILRVIIGAAIISAFIITPIISIAVKGADNSSEDSGITINVWQVDGFEGGKGSRKKFIEKCAEKLFSGERVYVTVTSLTQTAARENFSAGTLPDMISYSPTLYGVENYINPKYFTQKCWCYGEYLIFSLDKEADFTDITSVNCVINVGKDNLADVCAITIGLFDCAEESPTSAYLKLLNGKYKYMLGTQRDVYRFKARNADYSVKCVTEFNDLYQLASIITKDNKKAEACRRLIENMCESDVSELGLFSEKAECSEDALKKLKCGEFTYTLNMAASESYLKSVREAAKNQEINKLKNLLK